MSRTGPPAVGHGLPATYSLSRTCLSPSRTTRGAGPISAHHEDGATLHALWKMTPAARVAAMRRGELSEAQFAAWATFYPDQVPRVDGVPEWLAGAPLTDLFGGPDRKDHAQASPSSMCREHRVQPPAASAHAGACPSDST